MKVLRGLVGLFFVATGAFKLAAPMADGVAPGAAGFAEFLAAAGVPFPLLNAWLVCAVEIGCGAALLVTAVRPRPLVAGGAALVLAVDMVVAIITVGVRTQLGNPVLVRGVPTAGEPWRLALELVMLVLLAIVVGESLRTARGRA